MMTLVSIAERVSDSLSEVSGDLQTARDASRITMSFTVGRQMFLVTVEELPKDDDEPAV